MGELKAERGSRRRRGGGSEGENLSLSPFAKRASFFSSLLLPVVFLLLFSATGGCRQPRGRLVGDLTIDHPTPLQWTELEPGFAFTRLTFTRQPEEQKIMLAAVRILPQRFRFDLLSSPALVGSPLASLTEMSQKTHPVVAVNASLYRQDNLEPLGLVVAQGKVVHAWRKAAGSGIFRVHDGKAELEWAKEFKPEWTRDDLALQAGPLIVEPSKKPGIYRNARQYKARTAIGLDDHQRVIMVCTYREDDEGRPLSGLDLYELMQIFLLPEPEGGLGVKAAINLDGGTSTAMSINHEKLSLEIKSTQPISNGIAVYPR